MVMIDYWGKNSGKVKVVVGRWLNGCGKRKKNEEVGGRG